MIEAVRLKLHLAQLDRNASTGAVAACQDGRASSRLTQAATFGASASEISAGLA